MVAVDPIKNTSKTSHSLAVREVFTDLSYDAGVTEHPGNEPAPVAYRLAEGRTSYTLALERQFHETLVE